MCGTIEKDLSKIEKNRAGYCDDPADMKTILPRANGKSLRKFAAMHVEQGHIQLTKKNVGQSRSFLFSMSASAREFCEEQRKNPSADTIKRRQKFEADRAAYARKKQKVA